MWEWKYQYNLNSALSSKVLRPSLVTLCSHKSGRCAVELYHASLVPSVLHLSHTFQCSPKAATDKLMEKIVKHDSWPIQPDILSPPLLRLTSRKPLLPDLQPVDIKSRWRHNWKSAQVINSHLVCDPTIRQPGFDLPRQQWSLLNRFRTKRDTVVPAEGNGDLLVARPKWRLDLVARPRRCLTMSNPVLWQNWIAAYLRYTLQIKMLFHGWPVMVYDTHTRRRFKQWYQVKQLRTTVASSATVHMLVCLTNDGASITQQH